MLKTILPALCLLLTPAAVSAKTYQDLFGATPPASLGAKGTTLMAMDFKQGEVSLPTAHAKLQIPADYYFLNETDARRVLVDLWGNPPDSVPGTLGMIFPKKFDPADGRAWGAVVSYSEDGYVSDADAEATDFNAILTDLKQETDSANEQRKKQGFEKITLVGWASPPHYDKSSHTIHWARDLLFGDDPQAPHTLNYQLRALAREGVLNYNFVANMTDLGEIKQSIPTVTGMVKFDAGKTYGDYRDGDKIAAYGLAGLIAVGAGAKIAAKLGIIAIGLAFLKKGLFIIPLLLAGLLKPIFGLFRRRPDGSA